MGSFFLASLGAFVGVLLAAVLLALVDLLWSAFAAVDPPPPPVWRCPYCGAAVRARSAYDDHVQGHLRVVPTAWRCARCHRSFGDAESLREHLRWHRSRSAECRALREAEEIAAREWQA
jgi:uncharacterized C2H2 Zn-finger protein